METEKTLSEIARSVLIDTSETDPRSLREKAGLLALLNLLGIVESFWGEGENAHASANLIRSIADNPAPPASPEPPKEADLASSVMSLATKLLGTGNQGTGFDPSVMSALLGAFSALSKVRGLGTPNPAKISEDPSDEPESESDEEMEEVDVSETASQENEETTGTQAKSPKSAQPSVLQQILGIDPRIITLALNLLADLMKVRNANAQDRQAANPSGPSEGAVSSAQQVPRTEVTLTPDGKTVVIPPAKRQPRERLYHRPGLGIYRQKSEASPADDG